MSRLPEPVARLFEPDSERVSLETNRDFVMGRLLEEGDSEDLRWLISKVGESVLREWLVERGARQLSRRSLRFWSWALGVEVATGFEREKLWPH